MARRRYGVWVILGLAVLAGLGFLWQTGTEAGWFPWAADREASEERRGPALGKPDEDLLAELERRVNLQGLPGLEGEVAGDGVLTGRVLLHLAGAGPRPLPGVRVMVLAARQRPGAGAAAAAAGDDLGASTASAEPVETDEAGSFTFPRLRARVGYALVVRHAPYRDVVVKGLAVGRGRTTDVGDVLLGAPTTLTGEVVDAAGRPVAGAQVQVFADRGRPDHFDLRQGLFELQAAADPMAEAASQGDGSFAVKDLPPGRYLLRVSAPGYAAAFRAGVRVTTDERSGSARVILDPGAGWYGTVLDDERRGVADARVVAVAMPGFGVQRMDRVDVHAGPDGAYRLDTLVAGVRYFVEAWAEGRAPTGQVLVAEGVQRRDVTLTQAGRVEGTVTDRATGQGVADAQVTLLAGQASTLSPVSTVSGADGRYVLPYVAPGPLLLFSVKALGYQSFGLGADGFGGRRVTAGETTVLDASVEKGGTVSGRVLSPEGRPVPYATVALVDPGRRWEGEESAVTDASGRYLVHGLHAGTWELRVTAAGYAPLVNEADVRVVVPPDLGEVVREITLAAGAAVEGLVKTPEGAPVAGVHVEVGASGNAQVRAGVRELAAVSDAAGGFRLLGVPAGVDVTLAAIHDDWVRTAVGPLRLSPGQQQQVTITLRAGATLPGRVVDANERPVKDARVRWGHIGPDEQGRADDDAFRADEVLGARVLRTDADGQFRIERLEPGATLLKVEREGFADWYRRDLVVAGDGVQPILTVRLVGALSIRGRVTAEAGGAPLPGMWVYAEESKPGPDAPADPGHVRALVPAQTAADGTYVLDRLPPGRLKVVVWLPLGFQGQTRRDVAAGSTGVDFQLVANPPPAPPGAAR